MSEYTKTWVVWLLWFLLCVGTINLCLCNSLSSATCWEIERQALLKLKAGLVDPANRLSTWTDEDCCRWSGVSCDNQTGHVVKIDLQNPYSNIYDRLNGSLRVPPQLGNLSILEILDVGNNWFLRADDLQWLSGLLSLQHLDLNHVNLTKSSDWFHMIFRLPSLSVLTLSDCGLQSLPSSLKNQHANFTSLSVLDLSGNDFHSTIPHWMFNISSLTYLDLSYNNFNGQIPSAFENLISLEVLLLFGNSNLKENLPDILEQAGSFRYLRTLDLRNNMISGSIPASIGRLSFLSKLYLSGNQLNGTVPNIIGQLSDLKVLDLANNKINGSIPSSICKLEELAVLDISNNQLSGELPTCWKNLTNLMAVNLANNNLSGEIPNVCHNHLLGLHALRLSNNSFSGEIPCSMKNCTSLVMVDLGQNKLHGNIPTWMGESLSSLLFLRLRSNFFGGTIPPQICELSSLQVLDLADNNLTGPLPVCIGNFSSLNLSRNHLTGNIPSKIGVMRSMMTLDLSRNELSGQIPPSLSNLSFLNHLNLSFNNLSGRIPTGNQLQTLNDTSIYIGNSDLCGPPISQECPSDGPSQSPSFTSKENEDEGGDIQEMLWLYLGIVSGFILGCWMVWGVLFFKRSQRIVYFLLVDDLYDKVYVTSALSIRRLKAMKARRI
ncbi:Receptor-like protein kinase 5 [Acorus gramineus]|uniref:Receptor-like protein kinase 5 n=1 Tax=Acorus gramineus TaxID=55184 RepID=A0AAV8ZX77_ACOGR|nr:Receptor-like protein kinase 5 [Acorus gramineus]